MECFLLYRKLHGVQCHSLCCSEVTRKFFTEVEGWHMPQCPVAGEATDCLVLMLRINRNYAVSQKTRKLWNGIAQNCNDIWQKYSKDSNRVCMFQFSCRFAFLFFYQLFVFQTRHRKYYRCPVWKTRSWKSKSTWKLKHANSILEYFDILNISAKCHQNRSL